MKSARTQTAAWAARLERWDVPHLRCSIRGHCSPRSHAGLNCAAPPALRIKKPSQCWGHIRQAG